MEIIDGGCFNDVPAGGGGWTYLGSFDPTVPEEITGIPTTAVSVKVIFDGLSLSVANSGMVVELGDSTSGIGNGYATTGLSAAINIDGAGNVSTDVRRLIDGRYTFHPANFGATILWYGELKFSKKLSGADNDWVGSSVLVNNDTTNTGSVNVSSGIITVPGALNKVKLTVSSGVIDAGTVYVWYQ